MPRIDFYLLIYPIENLRTTDTMRKIRLESKSTTKGDILKCFGVIILGINLSLVHVEACAKKNKFVRFYRPPNFGQETSIYIV